MTSGPRVATQRRSRSPKTKSASSADESSRSASKVCETSTYRCRGSSTFGSPQPVGSGSLLQSSSDVKSSSARISSASRAASQQARAPQRASCKQFWLRGPTTPASASSPLTASCSPTASSSNAACLAAKGSPSHIAEAPSLTSSTSWSMVPIVSRHRCTPTSPTTSPMRFESSNDQTS